MSTTSGRSPTWTPPTGFPIPMRGNERAEVQLSPEIAGERVSNPHEG